MFKCLHFMHKTLSFTPSVINYTNKVIIVVKYMYT